MVTEVEGIVINEKEYSETSKILTVIIKQYGVISIISKGCRNIKSNLRSVSTLMTYGVFNIYYKEDKLSTLVSVDVINGFKQIRLDLTKISYASFLLELTEQVMKQNSDNEAIYDVLVSALLKIEEGYDALVITDIVSLKYLDYLGVMPVIDRCASCGSTTSIATLSSDMGGYVCNRCRTNEPIVNEKTIKLIRMFYYIDIKKIDKLEINSDVKKEIHMFISRYYERYTGLYFRTKKMLKVSENYAS